MSLPTLTANMGVLEAVNMALRAVGRAPCPTIASIENSSDALMAYQELLSTSREVQTRAEGWEFNSDDDVKLTANGSGEIILPANCLSVDIHEPFETEPVRKRGNKLYNTQTQSYNLGVQYVMVDMVVALQWDELPAAAQSYIAIRAARRFSSDKPSSSFSLRLTAEDEMKALAELEAHDASLADPLRQNVNSHFAKHARR